MRLMNSVLTIAITSIFLSACSSSGNPAATDSGANIVRPESSAPISSVESTNEQKVGGWAPVFFSGYSQNQVNDIIDGLNQGRIKKAVVSYPTKMQTLAQKIHDNIQTHTTVNIPMESVELKDTDQVKYDLKQVIVTLYFN